MQSLPEFAQGLVCDAQHLPSPHTCSRKELLAKVAKESSIHLHSRSNEGIEEGKNLKQFSHVFLINLVELKYPLKDCSKELEGGSLL